VTAGFPSGSFNQATLRVVLSSTTSSRSNPCRPAFEVLSFPTQGENHVDAVVSDFAVTNKAI
jgi:hypothetical protein